MKISLVVADFHGIFVDMLNRDAIFAAIRDALARNPVVVLLGPRQVGKTTLARMLLPESSPNYFDLEDPLSLARLEEPRTALESLTGLVVIDEIQRRPDLFPVLRVLADRSHSETRFLILGSASGDLFRQSAESLPGRMERVLVPGFLVSEVGAADVERLWQRGGFPRSFLAADDTASVTWRKHFMQTLVERDFPQWGVRVPATALLRFWTMLAHHHAQTWNATAPARALDVSPQTVRRHLDLLTDAMVVRQLHPWHANLAKRQVKAPKVYVRDSGLLHTLLGLDTERAVLSHPKLGASWEGFAIEQVLATEPHDEACFWATHQGAEIDLVLRRGQRLYGVECKRADAPRMTPSIKTALHDLKLERVAIVYPGAKRVMLNDRVELVPIGTLTEPGAIFPDA